MEITFESLINAGQQQVRNNEDLLNAYVRLFKEKFGYEPQCSGCSVQNDWNKFINAKGNFSNGIKPIKMEKTFKLFDELKIYTYRRKLDNGVEVPVRTYGYAMTEEYAKNYLTIGSEEQIKVRKAEFKILPKLDETQENTEASNGEELDLTKLNFKKLQSLAKEKGFPEEDWKPLNTKNDLITYIETLLAVQKNANGEEKQENTEASNGEETEENKV